MRRDDEDLILLGGGLLLLLSSASGSSSEPRATRVVRDTDVIDVDRSGTWSGPPQPEGRTSAASVYVSQWPIPDLRISANRGADAGTTVVYPASLMAAGGGAARRPIGTVAPDVAGAVALAYRRRHQATAARRIYARGLTETTWDERHEPGWGPARSSPWAEPGGWWFMPRSIPVRALHWGSIWSAEMTASGGRVVVAHGSWYSTYEYLEKLNVPTVKQGIIVGGERAGQALPVITSTVLGSVGVDKSQGSDATRYLKLSAHADLASGARRYFALGPRLAAPAARRWAIEVEEGSTTIEDQQ